MSLPININDLINGRVIESERIDFKEGFNDAAILHTTCAFANDINNWGGGYIIIGIADDGSGRPILPPVGLEAGQVDAFQKKIIELCHKIEPIYFPVISHEVFMNKDILVLWVNGGDNRPYKAPVKMGKNANKAFFVRHGSSSKIASLEEEQQLLESSARIPFDDRINREAKLEDFDILQIKAHLQEIGSTLYSHIETMKLEDICRAMQIAKGSDEHLQPLNVGVLFFAKNPQKFFKTAVIELVQFFDNTGDNFTEKTFSRPIQKQLVDVLEFIKNQVIEKRVHKVEGQAEVKVFYNYPFAAIEESVANAVYHKGYDVPEPIEIRIQPDRIEILSYPGPVPPVTSTTLLSGRVVARRYRNRRIGDFLKELKLTEGRGTGLLKINNSMKNNGSGDVIFETDNSSYFMTVIPIHPVFLNEFVPSYVPSQDTDNKATREILSPVCPKSVPSQICSIIVEALMQNELSSSELLELCGYTNRTRFRKDIIEPMMDIVIEFTIPDKPNSRNQKYRLTEQVRRLLGNNEP